MDFYIQCNGQGTRQLVIVIVIWDNWTVNRERREMSTLWRQSIGRHWTEWEKYRRNTVEQRREIQTLLWKESICRHALRVAGTWQPRPQGGSKPVVLSVNTCPYQPLPSCACARTAPCCKIIPRKIGQNYNFEIIEWASPHLPERTCCLGAKFDGW